MKKIEFNPIHITSICCAIIEGIFSPITEQIHFIANTQLAQPKDGELQRLWEEKNPRWAHNFPIIMRQIYWTNPRNTILYQLGFGAIFIEKYGSIMTVPALIEEGFLYKDNPSEQKYTDIAAIEKLGNQIAGVLYFVTAPKSEQSLNTNLNSEIFTLTNENTELKLKIEQLDAEVITLKEIIAKADDTPVIEEKPLNAEVEGMLNVVKGEENPEPPVENQDLLKEDPLKLKKVKEVADAVKKNDILTEKERKNPRSKKH